MAELGLSCVLLTSLQFFVALILLFLFYKIVIFIQLKRATDRIPGPKGLPILGSVLDLIQAPDELFTLIRNYAKEYYPIFRIINGGTVSVFLLSHKDVEAVISSTKNIEKGVIYEIIRNWLGDGLLLSAGEKWFHRRKLLTSTFHFTILTQFTNVFIEHSEKLIESIKDVSNTPIDVVPLITNFTLSCICETAMGVRLDETESGETYRESIHRIGILATQRLMRPWLYHPLLWSMSSNYRETKRLIKYQHQFNNKIIREREKTFETSAIWQNGDTSFSSKRRMAMLDLLLHAKFNDGQIDDSGIQDEVNTFMFEGHDTTATALSFSLMILASHKNVQDKILEEIQSILVDVNRKMTMDDLNRMKYLERVIKESLRLYPSVPVIARVISEDIKLPSGYLLPKNLPIFIFLYDLLRDSNLYPEPDKFDPDRFLPEITKDSHPYAYLPFSAGPRNCIGQKFAMLEMKTVLADVIRNFELIPIDTPETLNLRIDIILRNSNAIKVEFRPRI